jgi:hypothetical protein
VHPIFLLSITPALSAISLGLVPVGICLVEWMATVALRLGLVYGRDPDSAQYIYLWSHQFHMLEIHTLSITAKVVYVQRARVAAIQFPNEAVRGVSLLLERNMPIAVA